jgi:thiamine-phosphate pyrophosphorylase
MSPGAVRAVLGPGVIGLSTHDEGQIDEALMSPVVDYVAVGPIYETGTKNTGYSARGLNLVRYAAGRGKPVVAIGGIDLERAPAVIAAGASLVAVITDLYATGNVETRVQEYIRAAGP